MGLARQVGAETFVGRRPANEDAFCAEPDLGLFVVADGLGGHDGGEVASSMAVEIIRSFFKNEAIDYEVQWPFSVQAGRTRTENKVDIAVRLAHRAIRLQQRKKAEKMGATVVVAALEDQQVVVGHVGDSRLYRLRNGELEQLTRDHSIYNAYLDSGADLPPYREFSKRHLVTRALGFGRGSDDGPDIDAVDAKEGDVYLLCTDGLTDVLEAEDIVCILRSTPVEDAGQRLVEAAYQSGSADNITAVVFERGD
jgi:serine/threonine protein phosphatase PrpC